MTDHAMIADIDIFYLQCYYVLFQIQQIKDKGIRKNKLRKKARKELSALEKYRDRNNFISEPRTFLIPNILHSNTTIGLVQD
jgi:hypothetical protein